MPQRHALRRSARSIAPTVTAVEDQGDAHEGNAVEDRAMPHAMNTLRS